jgi:hypothetical protein
MLKKIDLSLAVGDNPIYPYIAHGTGRINYQSLLQSYIMADFPLERPFSAFSSIYSAQLELIQGD